VRCLVVNLALLETVYWRRVGIRIG